MNATAPVKHSRRTRALARWGCLGLLVAIASCGVGLTWFTGLLQMRVEYRDIAEAREDGFDERGWMPCFMPNSAFAISEAHDLDTNESAGVFRFGSEDRDFLEDRLAPVQPAGVARPRIRPRRWPRDAEALLTHPKSRSRFHPMQARCDPYSDATPFFLAVDWASQTVAYWSR